MSEDNRINVLDHGFVRLVDHMGDDLAISRAARVSYNAPGRPEDGKLISYLWRNRHTSPFEAVTLTFEVKAPIFVFRQWHRHRTWSYNEISARYQELPSEYYVPEADLIGEQSSSNKQMRVASQRDDAEMIQAWIEESCDESFTNYKGLIAKGVPRELARSVLPVATYSHMFASVNLLNLFRFCELRQHEHAQHEIRVYADAMIELVKSVAPIAVEAYQSK